MQPLLNLCMVLRNHITKFLTVTNPWCKAVDDIERTSKFISIHTIAQGHCREHRPPAEKHYVQESQSLAQPCVKSMSLLKQKRKVRK
jgi:hypothetical protein